MILCKNDKVEVKVQIPKKIKAPVLKDEKLGYLQYYVNGEVVKTDEDPYRLTNNAMHSVAVCLSM